MSNMVDCLMTKTLILTLSKYYLFNNLGLDLKVWQDDKQKSTFSIKMMLKFQFTLLLHILLKIKFIHWYKKIWLTFVYFL